MLRSTLLIVSVVPVADTVSNDGDFKAPRAATRGSEYAYFFIVRTLHPCPHDLVFRYAVVRVKIC